MRQVIPTRMRGCNENENIFNLVGLLFVSACGQESLNEQHKVYLSNKV